jgi:hypothetical protein
MSNRAFFNSYTLQLDFSQVRQGKQPSSDKIELPTHLIWRPACFPYLLRS